MRRSVPFLLLAVLLSAPGCAPRTRIMVLQPAQLDISGIGRLAVVDFQGPGETGKIARSAVLARLSENRHYALVDQAELARVLPAAFVQGTPAEGAFVEAARHANVDAILTGQVVSYGAEDHTQTDQHITLGGSEAKSPSGAVASGLGIGYDVNTLRSREASVALAIKLIDARTGEIRAARQAAHAFQGQSLNGQGNLPGREQILSDLLAQCTRDVEAMIAPHFVPVEVKLARQTWGNGLSAVRRGNSQALKGDWAAAAKSWQEALKDNPRNHAALHNLALAAASRGDFPTALANVEKAAKVYADSDYHKTRKLLAEQQEFVRSAMVQGQSRPLLVPRNTLASPPAQPQLFPPPTAGPVTPASFISPELPQRLPLPPE